MSVGLGTRLAQGHVLVLAFVAMYMRPLPLGINYKLVIPQRVMCQEGVDLLTPPDVLVNKEGRRPHSIVPFLPGQHGTIESLCEV